LLWKRYKSGRRAGGKVIGITNFRVDPGLTGVGATGASKKRGRSGDGAAEVTRNMTDVCVERRGQQQQVIQVEYKRDTATVHRGVRDYNGR